MFRNLISKNQVVDNVVVFDDHHADKIKADNSYSKIDGDKNLNSLLQKFKDINKKRTASGLSLLVLALPLSACGGGSSSDSATSLPEVTGRAIDGYLANSKVFLSSNPDVFVRTSDAVGSQGSFEGLFGTGSIVVREGVDISTGKTFTGELKAPEGSKVVTPITTIVEAVVSQAAASGNTSVTPAVAAQQVAKGLGLQSTSDLLNTDFVESGSAGMAKAAAKVASVISVVTASTGDEVSAAVLGNIAKKVAKAGEVGGKANVVKDAAELKNVFNEVRTTQAELFATQPATLDLDVLIDNVSNVVAKVSAQVDAAASLKDIAATQQAVQDDIVVAFTVDSENPEAFDPTVFEAALAAVDEGFDAIIAEAVLELDTYIATVDTGLDFEVILDVADVDETVVAIDLDIIDGALAGTIPDELVTGFVFGEVELETLDGVLDGTIDAAAVEEILDSLPEFDIFPEDPAGEVPGDIPDGEITDEIVEIITGIVGGGSDNPPTETPSSSSKNTVVDGYSSASTGDKVALTDDLQTVLDQKIAAASDNDTIVLSLAAGRYDQNLTIDVGSKNVTVEIHGAQYGNKLLADSTGTAYALEELDIGSVSDVTTVLSAAPADTQGGRTGGESWINGKITVKSDNVTLDGLRLHSYNGVLDFVDDASVDSNGIQGFSLKNSYATGFEGSKSIRYDGAGTSAAQDAGWKIEGNLIGGVAGGTGGSLYLTNMNDVDIVDNVFWRPGAAHMYLTDVKDVDVDGNLFHHGIHADGANEDNLLGQLVAADGLGYGYVGFSGGTGQGYGFGYGYGASDSTITKMGYGYGGGVGYGPSGYLPSGYGIDVYGGHGAKQDDYTFYGRNYIAEVKGDSDIINFTNNWGLQNSGGIQFWDEGVSGHHFDTVNITGNQIADFINADPDGLLSTLSSRHKSGLVGGVVFQVNDNNGSDDLEISGNKISGSIDQIRNVNDLDALIEVGGGVTNVDILSNTLVWGLSDDFTGAIQALNDNSADKKQSDQTKTIGSDTYTWQVHTQGVMLYGDIQNAVDISGTFVTDQETDVGKTALQNEYISHAVLLADDTNVPTALGTLTAAVNYNLTVADYGDELPYVTIGNTASGDYGGTLTADTTI